MNKKMNKKRIKLGGIYFPASLILVIFVIGFLLMLIIFARMSAVNLYAIRKEAEAGNELIRIYIYIDEVSITSNFTTTYTTTTQTITEVLPTLNKIEKTRITITNQWGKGSVIDYFVVEDWNNRIISKGEFNPPMILGAGEERTFTGNDILNTFKLNDPKYAEDFWFFKSKIRCITLHTTLGNTFGSAYKPIRKVTKTAEAYEGTIYRTTETLTATQTFTTTYFGSHTLKIESTISFYDCVDPANNVWRWYGPYSDVGNYYVYLRNPDESKNMMSDIIRPNQDPYGRTFYDGQFIYPAGILLTVSHSLPWSTSRDGFVYYKNTDNRLMNLDGGLGVNIVRMELWELDQFGNEVRKILETTSNSITFAMFGNYKLKRHFEARDRGQVSSPPTTTQTYTITQTQTSPSRREEITGSITWRAVRKDGPTPSNRLEKTVDGPDWWIEMISYGFNTHGNGYVKWRDKVEGPNKVKVYIVAEVIFTTDDPNAYIDVWMNYREWRYVPA